MQAAAPLRAGLRVARIAVWAAALALSAARVRAACFAAADTIVSTARRLGNARATRRAAALLSPTSDGDGNGGGVSDEVAAAADAAGAAIAAADTLPASAQDLEEEVVYDISDGGDAGVAGDADAVLGM